MDDGNETLPTDAAADLAAPRRIGPYRLVRPLGEGGMGVVYLAEQDEPVRRSVALKLLSSGGDIEQVVRRFDAERQALAMMDHPGITKVYDAGISPAGTPYFVMELVNGVPLAEYASRTRMTVDERLRLVSGLCRAIQHAHQKGIIHRDVKPSNVLVTDVDGHPACKVIDFGIARAVERTNDTQRLTRTGLSVGTPVYMSPEQVFGDAAGVDTRTDIYSLGVVLYELLAGVPPFNPEAYRGLALLGQHATREIPAPSARFAALPQAERERIAAERSTDAATLRKRLAGELDWIALKALAPERERRYETASALADDLERHLAHDVVLASPPGRVYRARKFVRRHRVAVASAATIALLLVTFSVTVAVQARSVARARTTAEVRQGQAEELVGFMLGDLRTSLTPIGRLDLLNDVGTRAMAYFAAVPENELSGTELYRRSQALRQLGEVRVEQGELTEATATFRQALALARGLTERDPHNGEWQVELGTSHFWLGFIAWRLDALDSAEAHFQRYVDIGQMLIARDPANLAYRKELSQATNNLAFVKEARGDLAGALDGFHATLALQEAMAAAEPEALEPQFELASSLNAAGLVQRKLGRLDDALASFTAEIGLKRRIWAADTADREMQRYLASAHAFLGSLRLARGEMGEARNELREARRHYAALAALDTSNAQRRRSLANSERHLGTVLLEDGEPLAAVAQLGSSRGRLLALTAQNPDNVPFRRELARTEAVYALALHALGRGDEAAQAAARSIALTAPAEERGTIEQRQAFAESFLAAASVLAGPENEPRARELRERALRAVDSTSRVTGHTDLLALTAMAMLALDRAAEAQPVIAELVRRGYRRPGFLAQVRKREVMPGR